jgi:GNAT superfamily N-acetyltransferase
MRHVITRPVRPGDTAGLLSLYQAAELAEIGRVETTAADITDLLHAPGLDLARRSRVAVGDDGIGGVVLCHPAPMPGHLRAQLCVGPTHPELATTLLRSVRQWVAEDRTAPDTPATLYQLPNSTATGALVEDGWEVVHSYTRMTADLADLAELPGYPVPAGVSIRPGEPRAVHAVVETAVATNWDHRRRTFEDFIADQRQRDGHDTSLWFLADVDGEPAGAVICRAPEGRAWVGWFGVLPPARGRSVGTALLGAAFAELRARGHARVGVDVDTHNETGAGRVYARAGMTVLGTADQWRRVYP